MCMGGGGDSASKAAAAQEAQRQQTISDNVTAINSAYANRGAQYSDYQNALQQQYATELNRQQATAARNLKFALARGGLTGGSAATDQGKLLGQETAQGTLAAQQQVQGAVSNLKAKDEATRQQMISLAQSGGDIGNAAIQTANNLSANLGNAKAVNVEQGLGDVFGGISKNIEAQNNAAALRKGISTGSAYANPFSRGSGGLGGGGGF